MHSIKTIFFLLLVAFCRILQSCSSKSSVTNESTVMLKIDSVNVPATIKTNIPFQIEFFSTSGNNGCYFSGGSTFATHDNDLIFRIYGIFSSQTKSCPDIIGYSYNMNLSLPGLYNIKIKQPDSTFLVKQITVN
jgi:hypothetical protein